MQRVRAHGTTNKNRWTTPFDDTRSMSIKAPADFQIAESPRVLKLVGINQNGGAALDSLFISAILWLPHLRTIEWLRLSNRTRPARGCSLRRCCCPCIWNHRQPPRRTHGRPSGPIASNVPDRWLLGASFVRLSSYDCILSKSKVTLHSLSTCGRCFEAQ